MIQSELNPALAAQTVNVVSHRQPAAAPSKGMSIRGLAGPYAVMAQNFAPGTTAADIESAVTPVGGIVSSCRLLKTQPIVIAEIVFESREGAENVISTFNNQTVSSHASPLWAFPGGSENASIETSQLTRTVGRRTGSSCLPQNRWAVARTTPCADRTPSGSGHCEQLGRQRGRRLHGL